MPVVAMGSPLPTEGQRENWRDLAQHAPEGALEGLHQAPCWGPVARAPPQGLLSAGLSPRVLAISLKEGRSLGLRAQQRCISR